MAPPVVVPLFSAHPDLQPAPWAAPSGHIGASVHHLDVRHGWWARPQHDLDWTGTEHLLLLLRQTLYSKISSHSFP